MGNEVRPNESEGLFLSLSYNKFYEIYQEAMNEEFWEKDCYYRFTKINTAFSIYAELLQYEPIKGIIDFIKIKRPPMEATIGNELFKFIRNVLAHFPYFECWNDVWISKSLINWYRKGQTIDKFLSKYSGHDLVKYRFWETDKKAMTYVTISFPELYESDEKIFLKDILAEKEGVKFSLILMRQILDTQVENC